MRKETVDLDILVTSTNGDGEVETIMPVQMNIFQSKTYRKDFSWPHFDNEPKVQEWQQVKDQQSYTSVFVAHLTIPSSS